MGIRNRTGSSIKVRAGKHTVKNVAVPEASTGFSLDNVDGSPIANYLHLEQLRVLFTAHRTPERMDKTYGPVLGSFENDGLETEVRLFELDGKHFSILSNSEGTREFLLNAEDPLSAQETAVALVDHLRSAMADEIAEDTKNFAKTPVDAPLSDTMRQFLGAVTGNLEAAMKEPAATEEDMEFTPADTKKFRKLFKKHLTKDEDDGEGGKVFGIRFVDEKMLAKAEKTGLLASSPIMLEEIGTVQDFMKENPGVWQANLIGRETPEGVGVYIDELVSKKPLTDEQYDAFDEFFQTSHIENIADLDDGCTFASWTPSEDKLDYETDLMGALGGFMGTLGKELTAVQQRGTTIRTDTEFAKNLEGEAEKISTQLIEVLEKDAKKSKKTGNEKTKLPQTPEGQAEYLEKMKKRDKVTDEANKATAAAQLALLKTLVPPKAAEKDAKKNEKKSAAKKPAKSSKKSDATDVVTKKSDPIDNRIGPNFGKPLSMRKDSEKLAAKNAANLARLNKETQERSNKISAGLLKGKAFNLETDAAKLHRHMKAVKKGTLALPETGEYFLTGENGSKRNLEFELESKGDDPVAISVYLQSPDMKSKHRVGKLDVNQYLAGTDSRPRWDNRKAEVEMPEHDREIFSRELARFIGGFSE